MKNIAISKCVKQKKKKKLQKEMNKKKIVWLRKCEDKKIQKKHNKKKSP